MAETPPMRWMLQTGSQWTGVLLRLTMAGMVVLKTVDYLHASMLASRMDLSGPSTLSELMWMVESATVVALFVGALLLTLGIATRCAAGVLTVMLLNGVGLPYGSALQSEMPTEPASVLIVLEFLLVVMGIALVLAGGGKWSLDRWIVRRWRDPSERMRPRRIVLTKIG